MLRRTSNALLPSLMELVTDGLIEAHDTMILKTAVENGPMKVAEAVSSGIHLLASCAPPRGHKPRLYSLAQAQQIALRNHPRIASAALRRSEAADSP